MSKCQYCHESLDTVRPRRLPGEEDTVALCRECWSDVQGGTQPQWKVP